MAAVDSQDLAAIVGQLYVRTAGSSGAYTRLASIRGAAANFILNSPLEIKADDTNLVAKYFKPSFSIAVTDYLECADRDIINLLLGGSTTDVAGTPVAVTGEVIAAAGASKGDVYVCTYKNAADTVVSSITVDDNGTPLVLNTNYTVNVDSDGSITGETGKTYITFLTDTSANQIDIDYTYTPNASESLSWTIDSQELPQLQIYIEGEDSSSKARRWSVTNASMNVDYTYQFVEVIENGDLGKTPLEFMANDGATVQYYNEIL